MEHASNVLFRIGPLEVTSAVTTMWAIIAVLTLVSFLATRRLKEVPGPLQSAAEIAIEKLRNYYEELLGKKNARKYFPIFATFFIYIIVCNYSGLLPEGLRAADGEPVRHGGPGDRGLFHDARHRRAGTGTEALRAQLRPAAVPVRPDAAAEPDRAGHPSRLAGAATLRQHVRRGDRDGEPL